MNLKTLPNPIKAIFTDIGGVLLTNGWDTSMRQQAAELFQIDYKEMNARHALIVDLYEIGKITLDDYLNATIFYNNRPFSKEAFKEFMFAQSQPYPEMIDFFQSLKANNQLKILSVNNEGREIMHHRIQTFHLSQFIDFFVTSCFVHLKKPDKEIFKLALDLAQVKPEEVIYIDDRLLLVEVAQQLGIHGIHCKDQEETRKLLQNYL